MTLNEATARSERQTHGRTSSGSWGNRGGGVGGERAAETLTEKAYEIIERNIVLNVFPPGSLLSELSLSRTIGIGRTPVREALQRLARENLVVVVPRRGVLVSAIDPDCQLKVLEMRREVERTVVGLAATRASLAQRQELRTLAAEMRHALSKGNLVAALDADWSFKRLLIEACANPFLAMALRPIHALSRRLYFTHAKRPDLGVATSLANVMEAIARGQAREAEDASDRFIGNIERFTVAALRRTQSVGGAKLVDPDSSAAANGSANTYETLSAQAFRAIEGRIVAGRYSPDSRLSEQRLSVELATGKTPVREALHRLASYHLVRIVPRSGAFVTDINIYDHLQATEARRPLERLVARLAARCSTRDDRRVFDTIADSWIAAAESGDNARLMELDQGMKERVARVANNPFLVAAIAPIHSLARRLYFRYLTTPNRDVAQAQVSLLRAMAAGDENDAALCSGYFIAEVERAIRDAMLGEEAAGQSRPGVLQGPRPPIKA